MIEVATSPIGKLTFDLPQMLKRDRSVKRARKDNYTCLLLGVEGAKAYFDIMRQAPAEKKTMFIPRMYGASTLTKPPS